MSLMIRETQFDAVLFSGPEATVWPSVGTRVISTLLAEADFSVAVLGPENISVRGAIPLPQGGGLVIGQDSQRRMHKLIGRSIVKFSPLGSFHSPVWAPDPFLGLDSACVLSHRAFREIRKNSKIVFHGRIVILGTGNLALQTGIDLLRAGNCEVYCLETQSTWGEKTISGWEVLRRRFEMMGGVILFGLAKSLCTKGPQTWEFTIEEFSGRKILEVNWILAFGPFEKPSEFREYPAGSLCFEIDQTADETRAKDNDGWIHEEESARRIAVRIAKALTTLEGETGERLEKLAKRAKFRLKKLNRHLAHPFQFEYEGKWLTQTSRAFVQEAAGTPKSLFKHAPIAHVECYEDIACDACVRSCPESAIKWEKSPLQRRQLLLKESACTACGLCLPACPASAITLLSDRPNRSSSPVGFAWNHSQIPKSGESVTLLNRKGDELGQARVVDGSKIPGVIEVDVPGHLIWDARLAMPIKSQIEDFEMRKQTDSSVPKVEILLGSEKRLAREGISVALALYEMGRSRWEESQLCTEGSCGLCGIEIDGVKKLACQTRIHRGMTVRFSAPIRPKSSGEEVVFCPCVGVTKSEIVARLKAGKPNSIEALLDQIYLAQGRCHGRGCLGAFRRFIKRYGVSNAGWIDWRFPDRDWTLPI